MTTAGLNSSEIVLRRRAARILRTDSAGRTTLEWLGLDETAIPAEVRARALDRYLSALAPGSPDRARVRELAGLQLLLDGAPVSRTTDGPGGEPSSVAVRDGWAALSTITLLGGPIAVIALLGVVAVVGNLGRKVSFPEAWHGRVGEAELRLALEPSPAAEGAVNLLGTSTLSTSAGSSTRSVSGSFDPKAGILTLHEGPPDELIALHASGAVTSIDAPCKALLSGTVTGLSFDGMWTCAAISRSVRLDADTTSP